MHQTRFFVIALISFFAVIAGAMLQKAITIFLCSILSFNSNFCYWLDNSRANAAIPPVTADSTSIIAQDIDIFSPDGSSSPPPQTDIFAPPNPQNQPQPQPGIDIFAPSNPSQPNQPQSIPQVNRSDANYSNQPSFLTVERGRRYQLKGAASNGSKRYTAELIVADDQTFLSSIVLAARTASSSQELIYNVQFERTGFGFTMTTNSGQAWTLRKIGSDRWMSQFTNADGTSKNWEFPAL
ncbi:MAG: hypothetical protein LDL41_13225, partial [Coleofasciculus sp. S288]|nr:hypothetical protein [Coleofasciculus sp. S288]